MQNLKGSTLLKVVSIIMIVFGAIALIVALLSIAGIAVLIASGIGTALLYGALVVSIIQCIIFFVAGILGVVYAKKKEKAGTVIVFGIVLIILNVLSIILSVVSGGQVNASVIISFILPVLYLVGGYLNKNSVPAENNINNVQ